MIDTAKINPDGIYQVNDLMEMFSYSRTGVETVVRDLEPLNLAGHKKYSGEQLLERLKASGTINRADSISKELRDLKIKYNSLIDATRMGNEYPKEIL